MVFISRSFGMSYMIQQNKFTIFLEVPKSLLFMGARACHDPLK